MTDFWYLWKSGGFEKPVWAPFLKTVLCSVTENVSEDYFLSSLFFLCASFEGERTQKIIDSLVRKGW